MTRKLFSVLIAICIVIGILPFTAIAVDAEATYTTSDGAAEGSFLEAIANVTDGGTITLLKNIEVDGTVTSPISKSFTLLGGGYEVKITNGSIIIAGSAVVYLGGADYSETLKIYSTDNLSSIFNIQDSAKLYIYDNVTLGPSTCFNSAGGIHLSDDAELHMYGGTITDCNNPFSICGGVAITDHSKFYMHGGTIQNCTGVEGGAISLQPGPSIGGSTTGMPTFIMDGGLIYDCTDDYYGGGAICVGYEGKNSSKGPFVLNITGGRIENCSAEGTYGGYGGAISIYSAKNFSGTSISISNLTISDCNAAKNGGAIYINLPRYMEAKFTNITLTGNTALESGGGMYSASVSAFSFNGNCTVTGNSAASGGGVAVSANSGMLSVDESWLVYDNKAITEGDDILLTGAANSSVFLFDTPIGAQLRCGHAVDGWYYDAASARWGTDDCVAAGGTVSKIDTDMPIFATAAIKAAHVMYELSYFTYGGTEYETELHSAGTVVELDKVPVRSGYRFTGWFADEALTLPVTSVTMDDHKSVHAGWERVITPVPPTPSTPNEPEVYRPNGLVLDEHFAYLIGNDDGLIRPEANITRAEVATIFFRLLTDETRESFWSDTNSYTDVAAGSWYNNAVSTLSAIGVLGGYEDGSFRPNASITRAEFAKIAVSFFELEGLDCENPFLDVAPGAWYAESVAAAAEIGLIEGYEGGFFRPDAPITRAEACTIVNRTLGRAPHAAGLLPESEMNLWPDNMDASAWYYAQIQEATNSHDFVWAGEFEQWTQKLPERDWDALQR